jgi:hypothetical protein
MMKAKVVDVEADAKVDHIKKVNKEIFTPGNVNAVDEMMVRFFGRSGHTYRMKNKPIKEGFKVWGLSNSDIVMVFDSAASEYSRSQITNE